MMKRWIWVTFQKEGIHAYADALTNPRLADVSFLGYPHRHIFHFKVEIQVFHNERDIEFIQFKRQMEGFYQDNEFNNQSCETLAERIVQTLRDWYRDTRNIRVTVSEDGENGTTLEWFKDA